MLYFVSNNTNAWGKMKYVQFDLVGLLVEPDPECHALSGKRY